MNTVLGDDGWTDIIGMYTDYATVYKVQNALKAKGFDPGTLDGPYGPNTSKAIKAFQTSQGLSPSGVIDDSLTNALGIWVTVATIAPGTSSSSSSTSSTSTSPSPSASASVSTPSFSTPSFKKQPDATQKTENAKGDKAKTSPMLTYGLIAGGAAVLLGGVFLFFRRK